MIRWLSLLSIVLLIGISTAGDSLAWAVSEDQKASIVPPAALTMYDSLKEHTLKNGLKVYLLPVHGSPVVTTMMAFNVGSCDEDKTSTGLAHYLEHLMFKGTSKLRPGDIDRMTQRSGGSNNAYTNHDMTNYHFDFAADRWETALDIEADRMRNLLIDKQHEFEQEKGAVIAELARNEDNPWDLEEKAILPLLFGKESPYGHPIIGEREHVRGASADVIKGYYNKWYHPNNAALIVVGGIDTDAALAKIKAKLEDIPSTTLPERKAWPAKLPERPARYEFPSKFPTPRMIIGFTTIPQGHPDESALDVASMILASGKTSRLYKKIVLEERMAAEVGCGHSPGRYPGWLEIQLELLPGKDRKKAEKIVLDEVRKLAGEAVPVNELLRCQRLLISQSIFSRESIHSLADSIAKTVLVQPASTLKEQFSKWAAVTPSDIQRVAKQYLNPDQPVVVWSIPKEVKPGGGETVDHPRETRRYRSENRNHDYQNGGGNVSLQQAKKVVLPNGLTLLLMENRRLPIVVAVASLKTVRRYETAEQAGVAQLMGSLLDEGTKNLTGQQIAEAIEDVGGSINMVGNGGSVKVLRDHKQLGLELLFNSLLHPSFPAEAFERKKDEQLSEIADAQEQPLSRASEAFQHAIYGKHFKGRPSRGSLATVQKLTRDDCLAFHKQIVVPENTALAVVGDFDSKEIIDLVTRLTAQWQGKLPPAPLNPEPAMATSVSTKLITMPNAAQLQFLMGHLGIKRDHPDFFKLLVMDNVLGSGAGFTDRLSARLRDREGLGYTVNATITDSAEIEPGAFICYCDTAARNYQRVKQLFIEEIERLRKEIPSEYEVTSTKQYLLGRLAFMLTTSDRIAEQLLYVNRYGLGFDYFDKYRASVETVTPAQVREMAEKYIQPGSFATVAAGAIDQEGRVITPQPQK